MPDIHVPNLDEHAHAGKSFLKIALEVLLIGTGVFLGLMGEQWRESRHHRELAESALHRFRTEIEANRKAVADVKDYHVQLRKEIEAYLAATPKDRTTNSIHMRGVRPAFIEQTAWELAVATQALTYMDQELAFALSRMHLYEQVYLQLTQGMLQAMYLRPPDENPVAFFTILDVYFADTTGGEPKLIDMYDDAVKQIDRALSR